MPIWPFASMTKEQGELLFGVVLTGLNALAWRYVGTKAKAQVAEVEGRNKTLETQINILESRVTGRDEEIEKLKGQTTMGLHPIINSLKLSLDNVVDLANQRDEQIRELRSQFESTTKASTEESEKLRNQLNLMARLNEWELQTRSGFARMDVIKKLWAEFTSVYGSLTPEKQKSAPDLARALTSLIRALKVQLDETAAALTKLDPTKKAASQ
jgi:chromosome segregation ATPase